jgi:DNA-binding beta-propeller fold protein YncE
MMPALASAARVTLLLCSVLACRPPEVAAGTANGLLDLSADGQLLALANRDLGTVAIVELPRHQVRREISVGPHPEGVAFLGASHQLAVAVYGQDRVVIVDADRGAVTGAVPVFDEPYGVVSDPAGKRVYVTLDYPGRVVDIDVSSLRIARQLDAGHFLRGIAISPAEERLYVTEFLTSRVRAIDLSRWQVTDDWAGGRTDNLCRQIVLHPRRPKAYFTHVRSRTEVAHGAGSIFPYVTVIDTEPGPGRRRSRFPMDAFVGNLVTANPWEIALAPDGRSLYVVFSGTDDMFACHVVDDDYREITFRQRIEVGRNPRAVRVAPDGATVYVYNALDFAVVGYSTRTLEPVATIRVGDRGRDDAVHQGQILFHSARQPMTGRRWIACSSCHPDGQPDGRTWQNPEGLRNTPALAGLAATHPLHWSADRDEVQDFEHTIRGPLMLGRGLLPGEPHPALGTPNEGRSAALDALAAYTNSHRVAPSPHARHGLSPQARRGRDLFLDKRVGCAACHPPPLYTDSLPRPTPDIVRHDVGTGRDDPSEKMGPAYDTPTLLGVYRTAPYLHHGRAETLEDVLTTCNPGDRHGVTSHLDREQVAALAAFLRSLPYEKPDTDAHVFWEED